MEIDIIDKLRDFIHQGSLVVIALIVIILLIAVFRPNSLRLLFKEFAHRRYILTLGVFVCMLSGTVYLATQPPGEGTYTTQPARPVQAQIQQVNAEPKQTLTPAAVQPAGTSTDSSATSSTNSSTSQSSTLPNQSNASDQARSVTTDNSSTDQASNAQPSSECKKFLIVCLP